MLYKYCKSKPLLTTNYQKPEPRDDQAFWTSAVATLLSIRRCHTPRAYSIVLSEVIKSRIYPNK